MFELQALISEYLTEVIHLKPNEVEVSGHLSTRLLPVRKLCIVGLDDLRCLIHLLVGVSVCGLYYVLIFHTISIWYFEGTFKHQLPT